MAEIALAAAVAVGAAILVLLNRERRRNDGLLSRLDRRAQQQAVVAEVGKLALGDRSTEELAADVAPLVAEGLELEDVAIWMLVPGEWRLALRAGTGLAGNGEGRDFLLHGETERALHSRRAIVAAEISAADLADGELAERAGMRSTAAAVISGGSRPLGMVSAYSPRPDAFGTAEVAFLQSVANVVGDADRSRRANAAWQRRALIDPLTERPNRLSFSGRLTEALRNIDHQSDQICVLVVDVDDLEFINDSFGRSVGDEILRALPWRLREALALNDTLAHFGRGQYAVLCEGIDSPDDASAVARRLLTTIERPFELEGHMIHVSVSVGVAVTRGREISSDELTAQAEAAMYRTKERNRGGWGAFDGELQAKLVERRRLDTALRSAPDQGELSLVVQPIVSLDGGAHRGGEVLLRWLHPTRGPIPPGEFIPAAEESGAIVAIGRWALRRVCSYVSERRRAGDPCAPIHLNVSARELAEEGFTATLREAIQLHGVEPGELALEITEHVMLEREDAIAERLAAARDLGVAVVLDDFGTGYSSLGQLKHFPIDAVKVDRMFIAAVDREPRDAAIVEAVIGIGEAYGLEVIAEGIESPEQLRRLRELGCTLGQGYLLGGPAPLSSAPAETGADNVVHLFSRSESA